MVESKFVAVERWDEHARKVHYKKKKRILGRENYLIEEAKNAQKRTG